MWPRIWSLFSYTKIFKGLPKMMNYLFPPKAYRGKESTSHTLICPFPPPPPPPRTIDGLPSCRLSVSKELCSSKGPRASWVGQGECTVEKDSWKQWYACLRLVELRVGYETWHLKRKQAVCKLTRPKEKRAGRMPSPRAAPAHSCVIDTCWWPLFFHQSWKSRR